MFDFETYRDPDFGVLLPTALVLAALGTNEYTIRKFRPLLAENQDYLRIRGQDHVERLFYAATGLIKLCDAIASPQAQALKQSLTQFLQIQSAQSTAIPQPASQPQTGLPNRSIVPAQPSTVYPYPSMPSSFDPYAPAPPDRNVAPIALPPNSSPVSMPPPSVANENYDPAQIIAQRLAPHLTHQLSSQVSSRVERALARLEQRQTPQLSQAELLLQQQQLSLEQFQAIQKTILEAQQAAIDQTHKVVGAIPAPAVNLFNSTQTESAQTPPEVIQKMMAALQIRSWSDLVLTMGGLLALGLTSLLLISMMMRPPQRVPVMPVPSSQPPPSPVPASPQP